MKKVMSLLCMCLILTLLGGINTKVADAETNEAAITDGEKETVDIAIIFNANGGKGKMKNGVISDDYKLPKNGFKKSGYKFVGWSTVKAATFDSNFYEVGAQGSSISYNDKNVTLYAQWVKPKAFKITYVSVKGAKLPSKTIKKYTAGKKTKLPIASATGEGDFQGWTITIKGKKYGPIMEIPPYVTGNIKLTPMIVEFEG